MAPCKTGLYILLPRCQVLSHLSNTLTLRFYMSGRHKSGTFPTLVFPASRQQNAVPHLTVRHGIQPDWLLFFSMFLENLADGCFDF